jgi:putative phage-type endonuclease
MIIHEMPQRSDEWFEIRRGKFTASDFDTLMPAKNKGIDSWTDTQMKIVYRVAAERMTGKAKPLGFTSDAMQWGINTESEARAVYEMETGEEVREVGFLEASEWIGCSPDGLIGEDKGLEIKCPNSETHLRYSCEGGLAEDYFWQVQGALWISGRKEWDIVSFDPRFDDSWQLHIAHVARHEESISKLAQRIEAAILKARAIIEA